MKRRFWGRPIVFMFHSISCHKNSPWVLFDLKNGFSYIEKSLLVIRLPGNKSKNHSDAERQLEILIFSIRRSDRKHYRYCVTSIWITVWMSSYVSVFHIIFLNGVHSSPSVEEVKNKYYLSQWRILYLWNLKILHVHFFNDYF